MLQGGYMGVTSKFLLSDLWTISNKLTISKFGLGKKGVCACGGGDICPPMPFDS